MTSKRNTYLLLMFVLFIAGCASPTTTPTIIPTTQPPIPTSSLPTISPDDIRFSGMYGWHEKGVLVVWMDQNNSISLRMLEIQGSDAVASLVSYANPADNSFTLSPDGTKVLYSTGDYVDLSNIYSYIAYRDATGKEISFNRFPWPAPDGVGSSSPAWSPDGKQIVYLCKSEHVVNVCVMESDGSNPIILTKNQSKDVHVYNPVWSPDGKHIAFIQSSIYMEGTSFVELAHHVFVMDSDGDNLIELTEKVQPAKGDLSGTTITDLAWSPDSSRVLFSWAQEYGDETVYLINANGDGEVTDVVADTDTSSHTGSYEDVAWSPDGTYVSFVVRNIHIDSDTRYLYTVSLSGVNQATPLRGVAIPEYISYAWSPDSKQIVYLSGSGLTVMNADGSGKTPVTVHAEN